MCKSVAHARPTHMDDLEKFEQDVYVVAILKSAGVPSHYKDQVIVTVVDGKFLLSYEALPVKQKELLNAYYRQQQ